VHEDASEGVEGEVGVIGEGNKHFDARSGSGTTSVHEAACSVHGEVSDVVGGMENKDGGVIESMFSGSGLDLSSGAEGAGVYRDSEREVENEEEGRTSDAY
jgi:hypothetical protein